MVWDLSKVLIELNSLVKTRENINGGKNRYVLMAVTHEVLCQTYEHNRGKNEWTLPSSCSQGGLVVTMYPQV